MIHILFYSSSSISLISTIFILIIYGIFDCKPHIHGAILLRIIHCILNLLLKFLCFCLFLAFVSCILQISLIEQLMKLLVRKLLKLLYRSKSFAKSAYSYYVVDVLAISAKGRRVKSCVSMVAPFSAERNFSGTFLPHLGHTAAGIRYSTCLFSSSSSL